MVNTFYHSTRSCAQTVTSKQAILQGLASDGGLYVSDELGKNKISLSDMVAGTYHENAKKVLGALLTDYTEEELSQCVENAYGKKFDTAAVTPVTELGADWLLELFHGPTCAFKDVALQMLPQLMSVAREGDGRNVMIVTATSGDTGKAALEGFANVPGCGVTVFYPDGKVSDIQYLQMVCQKGANVCVSGIRGTFDDAQTGVKRIFSDTSLKERLAKKNIVLSSANSINVGRLVPQVTYYFDAYAQLVRRGALKEGDAIDFCVPTGNFGDVLAGWFAKQLGLPVRHLIVASNTNKVLTDFIETGTYDRRRDFVKTISPSMDILVSSNLERLLYYLSDGDCDYIASLMNDLNEKGFYTVKPEILVRIQETFRAGFATDAETRATIKSTYEKDQVLIDTHTAVAKFVLDRISKDGTERVCLSTASPYKFCSDVLQALGEPTEGMNDFACMDALEAATHTVAPVQLSSLRFSEKLHTGVCDIEGMGAVVEDASLKIFARS